MQNETSTITKGDMIVEKEMHSNNKSKLVRERDFYRSKFEGMEKKIKSLTTDCAYLKKDNDGLRDRLKEMNKQAFVRNKRNFRR